MKKTAGFLVEKRFIILAAILIVTVVCGILLLKVTVNTDMTKYLPDSSSMKTGIDIMNKEFPAATASGDIRVMFDGLNDSQKSAVFDKLKGIPHVSTVDYDADSADYNNSGHTLYVVNFNYGYSSAQAAAVEKSISSGFKDYSMVYHVDSESTNLSPYIVILAVLLIMIVLFFMCHSWLEPVLLLASIGLAIVINMGTNVFLGSISETTNSISSILQLALSMDYAMVLLNRYRQELALNSDAKTAMKSALANAFHAIVGSALATMVGLLTLCFMSFKIGMDLGLVLSKGVFFSMVCILTVFPALLVMCDKGIKKTAKKVFPIKMNAVSKFSDKYRFAVTGVFVVIFIGACLLSGHTKIAYVLAGQDPTEEYFPKAGQVVVTYKNSDEAAAAELADQYTANPNVKDVKSFSTTLGKAFTAKELSNILTGMGSGSDLHLDPSLLNIVYYSYYKGNTAGSISAANLIRFIAGNVVSNEAFADKLGSDMKGQIDTIKKFAEPGNLTQPMSAKEIADFFGMKQSDITQLFVYYYSVKGGAAAGSMTLEQFADFIINDVATNKQYAAMFDQNTLTMINQLKVFTDRETVTKPLTSEELASAMGLDKSTVTLLMACYYANQPNFDAGTMTVPQFASFLLKDVVSNKTFTSYINSDALARITSPAKSAIEQLNSFKNFMSGTFSGTSFSCGEMAEMLGMEPGIIKMLYTYYLAVNGDISSWKVSLQSTVSFIVNDLSADSTFGSMFDSDMLGKLKMLQSLIDGTVAGKSYTSGALSKLLGMDAKQLNQLYLLYTGKYGDTGNWKMTVQDFVAFILSHVLPNPDFSSEFDTGTATQLKSAKTLINAVVSGKSYTSKELTGIFGSLSDKLDENTMDLLYLYYFGTTAGDPAWKLSINDLFNYLNNTVLKDPRFDSFISKDMKAEMSGMKEKMDEGAKQLTGPHYSRMILDVALQDGSDQSNSFIQELSQKCKDSFKGDYYLIGNAPMVNEMSQTFSSEHNFITILTVLAIFIVVLVTFRSFLIPLILVLIIQGGVYMTISATGLQGNSIYYLALLIVECILMGATIDYGILFASYYKESRAKMGRREALAAAANGSIHTILTSGLILILVTGIVGFAFQNPTIGQICLTISKGAFFAVILIVFILPGIIAAFDKLLSKRKNSKPD